MPNKKTLILLLAFFIFIACNTKEKEYNNLLKTADSLYHKNELENAEAFYQKAIEMKPLDSVLYKKIIKVNKAIMMKKKVAQYHKVVIIADDFFKREKYVEAQKAYMNASKIKPNDVYIQERIADVAYFLTSTNKESSKPYYIIVGSFKNKSNAIRLNEKLTSKGFNSNIIPRFSGVFNAVSYTSHLDIHDAYNNLGEARKNVHPDSWVLHSIMGTE